MLFQDLKKSLNEVVKPIYFISGQDAYLRTSAVNMIKDACLISPEFNLSSLNGTDVKNDATLLLNAVKSYPFLSDKRVVVVSDLDLTLKDIKSKKISEVFDQPIESTVLIIINSKKCEAILKQNNVTEVNCDKMDSLIISRWIRAQALKQNVVVSKDGCDKIIEYTLGDMTRISTEMQKLLSFVGENSQIDGEAVDAVVNKDAEFKIYELTDAIADVNYEKAYAILGEMLSSNEDKQRLFISIYYHYRNLLHVSISNLSTFEISKELGVMEFIVKRLKLQVKKFTPKKLKQICDKLSDFDGAFKCGEITVDSALWNSVFNAMV